MKNTILEATKLPEKESEMISMRLHEANKGKVFVIVEGDDDEKIYGRFFDTQKVTLYIADSCLFVVELLRRLNNNNLFHNKLIGIKDADFDHIIGNDYSDIGNLFLTDFHDIEMTMLSSEFETGLKAEYKIPDSVQLVEKIMEDIKSLSYLRLYNEREVLHYNLDGINFNDITFSDLYDGETPITICHCLNYVRSKCNNRKLTHFPTEEMLQFIAESFDGEDRKQLTRGHDFIYALEVRLKKIAGHEPLGYRGLCLALRFSCTNVVFERTRLHYNIDSWMKSIGQNLWRN